MSFGHPRINECSGTNGRSKSYESIIQNLIHLEKVIEYQLIVNHGTDRGEPPGLTNDPIEEEIDVSTDIEEQMLLVADG